MGRTAFLFPGQGAQQVGMGREFCDACAAARATFDAAAATLGWDVARVCFAGPQDELNRTAVSQPAILTVSLAIFRTLAAEAPALVQTGEAAAGLSLGEYSALVAGGALEFADGVRLVQNRGRYMEEACAERQGVMVTILGLDGGVVKDLCARVGGGEVTAANFNSPGQVVISGSPAGCERVAAACRERGAKRAVPLAVAGAFHSPFMDSAAAKLAPELARTNFRDAAVPVVANVTADYVRRPDEFRAALGRQVNGPVLWQQGIERLIADGFDRFIEVGPGSVLSGLMRRINDKVEMINVATVEALRKLKAAG